MYLKGILKRGLLPALFAAGLLAASAPAMAAGSLHRPGASPVAVIQADYLYHGHHYRYHYHGRYYNHRHMSNGHWRYY